MADNNGLMAKLRQIWAIITGHTLEQNVCEFEELIDLWGAVYRGSPSWLDYSYMSLAGHKQKRRRKCLNAAKILCSELAGLCFTEPPELSADDSVKNFLKANNFWNKLAEFAEYGAALGGFALKLYGTEEGLKIDYVTGDCFVPVSWDSSRIVEADFISSIVYRGHKYMRVEHHRRISEEGFGGYEITHEYFDRASGMWTKTTAAAAGQEEKIVRIASAVPLFVYIKTPEANNIELDSPLGVSVYANALDTLESLDIAFDALQHEIVMGKRRVIVPAQALRSVVDPKTGEPVQYFDPSDETFMAFNQADGMEQKIIDNTVELRVDSIRLALQTLLSILSVQVGFSAGYLNFDGTSLKTATEVISENSKTFKTKTAYENNIARGVLSLLEAVRVIGPEYGINAGNEEFTIMFNDDIIEDAGTKAKYWEDRYSAHTCTLSKVLQELDGLNAEDADAEAEKIRKENATVDAGGLFGGFDGA